MRDWQGKRYWLVGASEGLGRELAFCLSRSGVELVLSARGRDRLEALAAALPGRATVLPLDVTDAKAVQAAASDAGEIDGVACLVGTCWPMSARDWDEARLEEMAAVNYLGPARIVGAVLPGMLSRGRGHVVLTGALSGFRGLPRSVGYGASKAAVMHLAESLHHDLRGSGVEVQLVNPGAMRTRLGERSDAPAPFAMEPARAAREMFEHMSSDRFKMNFPYGTSLLMRSGQFLPDWAYFRLYGQR
ncbi:MAG: SDR family NAD(P)-dependent oxidoreductase [Limimaricola soesokkakensis]|uniref:SDR family NAD(P)-dependent oxidoreductase n=1 Tax=Limimaricola soesokkakensis TaxID=1343159 RepID=UPI0040589E48